MEALTLASVCYSPMHKYIDDRKYSEVSPAYHTTSPHEALSRVAADSRFDNLSSTPGGNTFNRLFEDSLLENAVLSHWNAWQINHAPKEAFQQSQKLATGLLIAAHIHTSPKYDFFLVHLLTTSHALRILLPIFPAKYQLTLLRQWWLVVLGYYIQQLRPVIDYNEILDYDIKDRGWEWIEHMASSSESKWSTDAHYVKGLRAMKVASETWGDSDNFYLKAAVRFAHEFDGWGGFAAEEEMM